MMRSWILQKLIIKISESIPHLPDQRMGEQDEFCYQTRTHIGQDMAGFERAGNWNNGQNSVWINYNMFFARKVLK